MLNFILQVGSGIVNAIETSDSLSTVNSGIAAAGTQAGELTETKISLIQMIMKGGPVMIILGALLAVSIYVLVERLLVISKAAKKNTTLLPAVKEMIKNGNIANARSLCKNTNTPEAAMIEQGVSRIGQSTQEIREAMNKSGSNELGQLEKNLNVLNIIGRIAPMFGFIGTIIGVIKIFYDIALAKSVEIEIISTGLYQKMITSAGGLVVGVFAFVGYHWLNAKLDKLSHRMETSQIEFLDMLNEPGN